jgi:hypothetical protein
MKKTAILICLVMVTSFVSSQGLEGAEREKFAVNVTFYSESKPEINGISRIETERVTAFGEEGSHQIKTLDKQNETIMQGHVNIAFRTPKGFGSSEYITTNFTSRQLFIDFHEEATKLEISGPEGSSQKSIVNSLCNLGDSCTDYCRQNDGDVLSCTCGDGICQEDLNEDELCPQDCETPSQPNQQDQEEDNEANQEDQSDTVNTSQEQSVEVVDSGTNTGILVLIGVLFILVALVLVSGKVSIEA